MKALAKERDQRYETANGLAKDIERFLNHKPVLAGPPSAVYRLRKLVRRHRPQVIACGLVLLALLAGIGGTTFGLVQAEHRQGEAERAWAEEAEQRRIAQANEGKALLAAEAEKVAKEREAEQRRMAERARDRTREALDAMTSSITGDSLMTQKEISAEQKKFLTEVLTYYQEFAGEKADDPPSRVRTAEAAHRLGFIEFRLGFLEEALAAADRARAGYERLVADFPTVPDYRRLLAINHHNLGHLLAGLGKVSEAEERYRQALAVLEKLVGEFPAVPDYRQLLARSHNNLGLLLAGLGKVSEAEEQYRQALTIQGKLATEFPGVPDNLRDLVMSHNNLGGLLQNVGKGSEAEKQLRQALAIQEKLAVELPAVPDNRCLLAINHNNLEMLLRGLGKVSEAEEEGREGLAVLEKLVGEFPAVPDYRQLLALSHNGLGLLLADLGKVSEAEEQYRQGLAILEKLATEFPGVPDNLRHLAMSHNNLGLLLGNLGKRSEAEEQFRRALTIQEKLVGGFPAVPDNRRQLALSHNNLGGLLADLGKVSEAVEQYRKALTIQEKLGAEFPHVLQYPADLGGTYCNFGRLLRNTGQPNESLVWFEKAIRTLKTVYRQDRRLVVAKKFLRNSYWGRALAYDRLQKYSEAIDDWDKTMELSRKEELPTFRGSRATSLVKAGKVAEAVAEVAELTKSSSGNAGQWYNFACVYALVATKSADKKAEYGDRAMGLLQKAVKAGYHDVAHMHKDTDLDSLRGRGDFKKLFEDLEKKSQFEKAQLKQLGGKFIARGSRSSWSPDSKKIVFGRQVPRDSEEKVGSGLAVFDVRTSGITQLLSSGKDPAWSPGTGRWIAYVEGGEEGMQDEVWLVQPSGAGRRKVAQGGFPSWSADGQTLFFHDRILNQVKAVDVKDGGMLEPPRKVLATPFFFPVASPDPLRFALRKEDKVAVIEAASGKTIGEWRLPPSRGFLANWSPDGNCLGFGGYGPDDARGLWVLRLDRGEYRRVLEGAATLPCWSPDGTKLSLDLRLPTGCEIWALDAKVLDTLPSFVPPTTWERNDPVRSACWVQRSHRPRHSSVSTLRVPVAPTEARNGILLACSGCNDPGLSREGFLNKETPGSLRMAFPGTGNKRVTSTELLASNQ